MNFTRTNDQSHFAVATVDSFEIDVRQVLVSVPVKGRVRVSDAVVKKGGLSYTCERSISAETYL